MTRCTLCALPTDGTIPLTIAFNDNTVEKHEACEQCCETVGSDPFVFHAVVTDMPQWELRTACEGRVM